MSDEELKKVANEVRKGIVTGVHAAKSGHPGGSLGAADIMTYLYFEEMNVDPADPRKADRDRFVLSKGHCAPGLYAVLAERGFFPKEDLETLRHIGRHLQGHPNMTDTPGVDMSTGSLGQGISAAVGMALAAKHWGDDYRTYAPQLLSGGQKQRVAIAGVLAMQPQCVVLDEPTAMLDPQGRREVLDTIERLNREKGITVILITHHMDEAVRAGRVIAMSEGKIIADGTPQQVFAQEKLLRSVGLDVPQTEQLLLALRARGVDIPTDALTPGQCARLLRQYIPAV